MNRDTREIVGVYLGDRSVKSALGLWHSLPEVYRKGGMAYTDFWETYAVVFPKNQLRQCGKETGQTSHIEHFNNTLRQRVGRLVCAQNFGFFQEVWRIISVPFGFSSIITMQIVSNVMLPYDRRTTSFPTILIL